MDLRLLLQNYCQSISNNGFYRFVSVAFKKEVVRYIHEGHSAYAAAKHFSVRDRFEYNESMFYQWLRQDAKKMESNVTAKRMKGARRKPVLQDIEALIKDEIIEMRSRK